MSISQVASLVPEHAALEGEALGEWIASEVAGNFHPVGTCRMGTPRDPMAVVDGVGRVIGVEGLRVIDASILPGLPRANTHLTVLAVAERLAEDSGASREPVDAQQLRLHTTGRTFGR